MSAPHYLRFAKALALVSGVSACSSTTVVGVDGATPLTDAGPGAQDTGTTVVDTGTAVVDVGVIIIVEDAGIDCRAVLCAPPPVGCSLDQTTPECCDWICECDRADCPDILPAPGCVLDTSTPDCCDYDCPNVSCGQCSCGPRGGDSADAGLPDCESVGRGECCFAVGPLLPPDVA